MKRNEEHISLIKGLGGPAKLAAECERLSGKRFTRGQVAQWQGDGVAHRWRPLVLQIAGLKRKKHLIPENFIISKVA